MTEKNDWLISEEIREKIPCGESVTTKYLKDGEIVRQDVKIIVDPKFMLSGAVGN